MNDDVKPVYTEEQYLSLKKVLDRALAVCPPDEYQKRQNDLTKAVACFLLEPYHLSKRKDESAC